MKDIAYLNDPSFAGSNTGRWLAVLALGSTPRPSRFMIGVWPFRRRGAKAKPRFG